METKMKPIPAFYCCYLLRSTVRHASLYVGSSPNPMRRLNQHNGKSKGGAVRTSRVTLRPWEMTCIVAGFPSNIAALQFEWAWQNAHLTRHIAQEERISFPVIKIKTNSKTGKTRRKPVPPPSSLVEKLSNLHLLLRTKYFSQWPLHLRFFSEDVYQTWQMWNQRIDKQIRPGIEATLDVAKSPPVPAAEARDEASTNQESPQRPAKRRKVDLVGSGGVEGVDATYARYQDVFEKTKFLLDEGDGQTCSTCRKEIDVTKDLFTVCTTNHCTSMSHIDCLATEFLEASHSTNLIPERGTCPDCRQMIEWSELIRAVSLRMRAPKEVAKILKKKRGAKAVTAAELMEEEQESEDEDEELTIADVVDEDHGVDDEDEDEDDFDDNITVASVDPLDSTTVDVLSPSRKVAANTRLEIVIEDSEDER